WGRGLARSGKPGIVPCLFVESAYPGKPRVVSNDEALLMPGLSHLVACCCCWRSVHRLRCANAEFAHEAMKSNSATAVTHMRTARLLILLRREGNMMAILVTDTQYYVTSLV